MASEVLTNLNEIWAVPHDRANERYRIKTEFTVYFDDSEWGNASGECNGVPCWLPIFDAPYTFKSGERIAIDGVIIPESERFVWSETKTRILQENVPFTPIPVTNLSGNPDAVKDHLVSAEGLIDTEIDQGTHCTIVFLQGGTSAYAYVMKGTNSPVPFKPGDIIRITGVYSAQFDKGGKLNSISLWAGSQTNVKVIGSIDKDARFNTPVTSSHEIQFLSPNNLVHVAGVVHKYEAGQWATIWDKTGQILVQSKQSQTLRFGDVIEAIGYPYYVGVQSCLHDAVYRVTSATNAAALLQDMATNTVPLCLAEQVRDLSLEDAARHLPVTIQGIVTWSHADTSFAYVQDGSGGIKVMNPRWDDAGSMKPGTIVRVDGVTYAGGFVPIVTNAVLRRAGWFNIVPGPFVTLEQALTGIEEGNWVEMQGFVRNITRTKGLVRFDLSTSSGEFAVWGPATQSYDWYKGSIIRVDGVCSAMSNRRHQMKGIQLWTPDINTYAHVEVPAPDDVFAAPFRRLANLRRFNVEGTLNQRLRTTGTVVQAESGRGISLQDGVDSVLALSQQKDPLQLGDKVEVVGFPGQQGQKFVLREAAYRRISSGPEPAPMLLSATNSTDSNLEGLLVQARGTVLNVMKKNGETRMLVQAKGFTFEAGLAPSNVESNQLQEVQLDSQIIVKGVYEMQRDEYGRPASFLLRLRSGNDIQLAQEAPWWTTARLLAGLVGTMIIFLVALIWGLLIARKNKLLSQVQTDLRIAKDKLEVRVDERTRELQTANERLKAEMAERQETEKALRQAQKMEALGQLAGGIAHDFNNLLTVIRGYADCLQAEPIQPHERDKAINEIRFAADRAAKLTSRMLIFCRKKPLQRENVDLNELIRNLGNLLKRLLGENIAIEFQSNKKMMMVHADSGMMEQIILNLAVNARDAMPNGGRLSIHADEIEVRPEQCTANPKARPGPFICIAVSDTGSGITPEVLPHLFEPFFTTKELGKGTGMGLATVYGIVQQHTGWIEVESQAGCGATFKIFLPGAAGIASAGTVSTTETKIAGGTESILLVEDEEKIRQLAEKTLRAYGYRVYQAGSGAEALSVWSVHAQDIDLLFTDIMLPGGMSGCDLAKSLQTKNERLKIAYTTGYAAESFGLERSLEEGVNLLHKPYSPNNLACLVRRCLDEPLKS